MVKTRGKSQRLARNPKLEGKVSTDIYDVFLLA
jgi:hypothetical protein